MKRGYKSYNRKEIEFEDDLVIVFDEDGNEMYKGLEDYEPMRDDSWKYDYKNKIYTLDKYIKICLDV